MVDLRVARNAMPAQLIREGVGGLFPPRPPLQKGGTVFDEIGREERERVVAQSLADTRAMGFEPSERSKELAVMWVDGRITFTEMALGITKEAWKEEAEKRNPS